MRTVILRNGERPGQSKLLSRTVRVQPVTKLPGDLF